MAEKKLNIEISEEVACGKYANMSVISHSSGEFVLDFVQLMPNTDKAQVRSRVILNPEQAKRLAMALHENLRKYEDQFGEIRVGDPRTAAFPLDLNKCKGEA